MCPPLLTIFKTIFSCLFFKSINVILCPFALLMRFVKAVGAVFTPSVWFGAGFVLGQVYYDYLLMEIPFPPYVGRTISLSISLFWGAANAVCRQMRCISLLTFPMYCGKPGRAVLKAVVLTYVIAGPVTNMGLNAKEVVRVFACSTRLARDLSLKQGQLMAHPLHTSLAALTGDAAQMRDVLRITRSVAEVIEKESAYSLEGKICAQVVDNVDDIFAVQNRSYEIEKKYAPSPGDTEKTLNEKKYAKKLEYRCHAQMARAAHACYGAFQGIRNLCDNITSPLIADILCWPLYPRAICKILPILAEDVCDRQDQVNPGLGEALLHLRKVKEEMTNNLNDVKLQYKVDHKKDLLEVQDATETGSKVMHEFEEKHVLLEIVVTTVNLLVALLFIRIIVSATTYHDTYLTSIGFDNVYITKNFKAIDHKTLRRANFNLLPLKKMERNKYVDVCSLARQPERSKRFTQVLKLLLEMVTATTFVMLDRLFYEALDVVRQHAEAELAQHGDQDLQIQVDGKGMIANLILSVLSGLNSRGRRRGRAITNKECLPRPRSMPPLFYLKIYGGYLWILLLIYLYPYTIRFSSRICARFYPQRERQRISHLYNDILKKRLKMDKTLRRNAVQTVRAYYLAGENMLSLRLKFPHLLGWLSIFPAARKTCLICGETEPRSKAELSHWHRCTSPNCPFIYCAECWTEVGGSCLACDSSLADLSDIDSLSDDEQLRY